MQYVIVDLEWNNTYNKPKASYFNEIIEIGAVKVDENLKQIDTFRVFVKVQISKKLHTRVKNLTHIQNEDIHTGQYFDDSIKSFSKWLGDDDTVILTWGETDLLVLIDNFKIFTETSTIPFMKKYANLQLYVQQSLNLNSTNQLGLSAALDLLKIDTSGIEQHRALDDCILSAECMRKIFSENTFNDISEYVILNFIIDSHLKIIIFLILIVH